MNKKNSRHRSTARSKRQQGQSMLIPFVVGVVIVVIVAGIILFSEGWLTTPASSSQGNTALPLNTSSLPYPNVPRIGPEESQSRAAQGLALLVDVRSSEAYDKSHATGAISMPEAEIGARLDELPKDKEIILYCT